MHRHWGSSSSSRGHHPHTHPPTHLGWPPFFPRDGDGVPPFSAPARASTTAATLAFKYLESQAVGKSCHETEKNPRGPDTSDTSTSPQIQLKKKAVVLEECVQPFANPF